MGNELKQVAMGIFAAVAFAGLVVLVTPPLFYAAQWWWSLWL